MLKSKYAYEGCSEMIETWLKEALKNNLGRYVAKYICLFNSSYWASQTNILVVRYYIPELDRSFVPGALQRITRNVMGTRSEMYDGCTNMLYTIYLFMEVKYRF